MQNKLPPTERIQENTKRERRLQSICPTNLPESFLLESILAEWCELCASKKDPESKRLVGDNPETNPIIINP